MTSTLVCVNLQTTGLDPKTGYVLEAAVAVVQLVPIAQILSSATAFVEIPSNAVIEDGALRYHQSTGMLSEYAAAEEHVHLDHWLRDAAAKASGTRILATSQGTFCLDWLRAHAPGFVNSLQRNHYLDPDSLARAFNADKETASKRALTVVERDAGLLVEFAGALGVATA